jgi:hypothetical protein
MSFTIPFRVFGKFHFFKFNDDMIFTQPHKCPYFNDGFPDKQYPDLLSNTLVNYCSNCCESDNMEYSAVTLSLCGLGKEDIVDTFISYEKQLEMAENVDTTTWKSALFICPNCHDLYYVSNIKELIENIQKTTKLNQTKLSLNRDDLSTYLSLDTQLITELVEKYNNELNAFYDGEMNEYLTYILNNILQFNLALKQMYSQMKTTDLNKITFSLSFIWFTKPFYTAECTFAPPMNIEDYHKLYDKHLFNYVKNVLPDLTDITIKYPELNETVKSMNLTNNTELGVDFTLQF